MLGRIKFVHSPPMERGDKMRNSIVNRPDAASARPERFDKTVHGVGEGRQPPIQSP